ncbi:MAG: YifB family Mg chelatase-like AAA ATPase [Oscillospiraceae bacterium]|nr:YifB family Mg chelatase-like AAA ATPase [Oscillospiraceae bacterium]
MYAKVNSLGLFGLNAFSVDVEIETSRGTPAFDIIGLADTAVKESRERIRSALRASDMMVPIAKVVVNLAPADTKKSGSVHDLAIFTALLAVNGVIEDAEGGEISKSAFIGEVSLNGDVRPVNGVLPMTLLAKRYGYENIFVPSDNAYEASVVEGIRVYGVKNTQSLIGHFYGDKPLEPFPPYQVKPSMFFDALDFADVKGQQTAKKALEYAAAGGHNLLMVGTPGSGKSMLAKRMTGILPAMTFEESIETTNIHSISGMINKDSPLITVRPFRSPHHTISTAGLAGGGTVPRPGEISLSHNGLLFLDELAEFDRPTLELLRQPLEDKKVTIARAAGTVTYPCAFMLVGAMNPCPCGYYGHPVRKCTCSKNQVMNYLSKISGPMLDRFDLHVEVAPVEFEELSPGEGSKKEESSSAIRERVQAAREIQSLRYKGTGITCNAGITPAMLSEVCPLTEAAKHILKSAFDRMGLSARAYDRIVKVARTIADMSGVEVIDKAQIAQAVQFRSLDRKYWS